MSEDLRLAIKITADGKIASAEIQRVGRDGKAAMDGLEQSGKKGADAINRVGKEAGGAAQQTEKLKSSASGLASTLAAAFSTAAVIAFGRSMVQTLQVIQGTDTRLRSLTKSAQDYAESQDYLARLAARHHKEIDTLADSEARLLALEKSGLVTRQQNKALLEGLSNASSALGAQSAQLQQVMLGLGQALSAGVVHAEELAQVTEPLPGLLQALDRATGQTAGGFRKLVNDGEITSAMFRDSLIVALRDYEGAATATAANVGSKFVDLSNSYRALVKTLETPISEVLTPILDGIAERVEIVSKGIDGLKNAFASIVDPAVAFKNRVFGFSDDKIAEIQQADTKRAIDAAFPTTTQASGTQQATVDLTKYAPAAEKAAALTHKVAKAHASASSGARSHASAAESLRKEEERRYESLQSNADRAVESTFDERQRIEERYKESADNIIQFEEAAAKRGLDVGQKYADARVRLEQQKFQELAEITRREEDQVRQDLDEIGKEVFDEFNKSAKNSADEFEYAFEQASKNIHNTMSNLFESLMDGTAGSFKDIVNEFTNAFSDAKSNSLSLRLEKAAKDFRSGDAQKNSGGLWGYFTDLLSTNAQGKKVSPLSSESGYAELANVVSGVLNKIKFFQGPEANGRTIKESDKKTADSIMSVFDLVGEVFWPLKFVKPVTGALMNLHASAYPDRRPDLLSSILGGPGAGYLFGSVPKGGATVNLSKNNVGTLESSFEKGDAKDFERMSQKSAFAIAESINGMEKLLDMEFGRLKITTYNRGQDTSFAVADKTGNRYYTGEQEAKKFDMQKAVDEAIGVLIKDNITQLSTEYRAAARGATSASDFVMKKGRVDEILAFTGQKSELVNQLKEVEDRFEQLRKRAKNLALSTDELNKSIERQRAAIKRGVEDQFRALAGLAPTLQSALGSLNDQIIKLTADARAVGMSEGAIGRLSALAVSNAKTGYLSPVQTALDGVNAFLGKGAPVDFDQLMKDVLFAETPEDTANAMAKLAAAAGDSAAKLQGLNDSMKGLDDFLTGLATSDLSALNPEQRYQTAKGDFGTAILKAQAGDQAALASLPQLAQRFLGESQNMFASSGQFVKDYQGVESALKLLSSSAPAIAAAQAPAAMTQTQVAEFGASVLPAKLAQFGEGFDVSAANNIVPAAPITKNAVDLIEDEIASLENQKAAIKGTSKAKKRERALLQDQIDALKKRKKLEIKKLNAKAGGGWTSGLTLVGEAGPELIDVPGAALVSNHRATQNILTTGNDAQVAELRAQTKELQALVRLQQAANKALLAELQASREHLYDIDRRQRLAG